MSGGELLAHRLDGEGEPLLLLNGGLMTYAAWEPLAATLRGHRRLLLCDLRGQLLSPGRAPRELADNVADLTALLDHLGLASVDVLGTSYGGAIGLLMAALVPERVRSLVAVTVADHADETMRQSGEAWRAEVARAADPASRGRFYDRLIERVYSDEFRRRNAEELAARRAQVAAMPDGWFEGLEGILAAVAGLDLRPHLGDIRAPVLVVAAAADRLIPVVRSRAVAAAIDGAELRVHPASGHALVAEDPVWLAAASLDFLAQHGRAAADPHVPLR